jgi:hypothetical protein
MAVTIASRLVRAAVAAVALALVLLGSPVSQAQDAEPATEAEQWEVGPEPEDEPADVEPRQAAGVAQPEPRQPAPAPRTAAPAGQTEYADTDPRALTDFEPELRPYGVWVNDPRYGLVWVPHAHVVGADFAPYVTSGHWGLTPEGDWIWVSDYPFGWVVFHYGRWVWISGTGWAWIPGRHYAHAWVVWRVPTGSYAYVGWAPAPPSYIWVDGVAVSLYYYLPCPYVFVPSAYVFSYHVHRYVVLDRVRVRRIAYYSRRYAPARYGPRRGPSLASARVPARRVPVARTPAHPRALAAARPAAARGRPATASATGGRDVRRAASPLPRSVAGARRSPRAYPGASTPAARSPKTARRTAAHGQVVSRQPSRAVSPIAKPRYSAARSSYPRRLPASRLTTPSRSYSPARLGGSSLPRHTAPRLPRR